MPAQDYYCLGGSPGGAGVPVRCPNNLATSSTGSKNDTYCAAGPGYFYDSGTNSGIECYDGQYKSTTDRCDWWQQRQQKRKMLC